MLRTRNFAFTGCVLFALLILCRSVCLAQNGEIGNGANNYYGFENAGFAVTPPQEFYYNPVHCSGIIADAEWLNWRTSHSNQTFANYNDPVWLTGRSALNIDPKGNGIRTRIGARGTNGWDIAWNYTYFDGDDSAAGDTYQDPSSVMSTPLSCLNLGIDSVSVQSDTTLNIHDLEFGRWIGFGDPSFDIRPFASFRYASVNEDLDGQYRYGDPAGENRTNDFRHSSKMEGYGIRVGCETEFNLHPSFSVFGRGAGSVLKGDIKSVSFEKDEIQGIVLNRQLSNTLAVPVIEAAAGLAWRCNGLEIKGGYELSSWFNASSLNGESSDVLFHGFFAGGSWNY